MSFTPKPCAHCGGRSFHLVPNLQLEYWQAMTAFGLQASRKATAGARWTLTLVICTQCGRTEAFTVNGPDVAQRVQGSSIISC
jgi:ribosomal protein L37E